MYERSLGGEYVGINEHDLDFLLYQIFPNKFCFFVPQRTTYLCRNWGYHRVPQTPAELRFEDHHIV